MDVLVKMSVSGAVLIAVIVIVRALAVNRLPSPYPQEPEVPAAEKGFSVALGRCIFLPDDSGKASVAYKRLQAVGTAGTAGSPPGAAFVGGCGPGGV